jgi:Cys-tRNA(Pro) deacylase
MAGILPIREKSTLSSPVPLFLRIHATLDLQFVPFARPLHFLLQCHRMSDILEGTMAKQNHIAYPVTPAIRLLREKHIPFVPHLYPYQEHGGTHHAAAMLTVPEHAVIKTLVMMTDEHQCLLVLMHGDCNVSTKKLARTLSVKQVTPCSEEDAHKYTGYLVGGISPFGTRTRLPVYAQTTIFSLERIYINGGKHGFLVAITPSTLHTALSLQEVDVTTDG